MLLIAFGSNAQLREYKLKDGYSLILPSSLRGYPFIKNKPNWDIEYKFTQGVLEKTQLILQITEETNNLTDYISYYNNVLEQFDGIQEVKSLVFWNGNFGFMEKTAKSYYFIKFEWYNGRVYANQLRFNDYDVNV